MLACTAIKWAPSPGKPSSATADSTITTGFIACSPPRRSRRGRNPPRGGASRAVLLPFWPGGSLNGSNPSASRRRCRLMPCHCGHVFHSRASCRTKSFLFAVILVTLGHLRLHQSATNAATSPGFRNILSTSPACTSSAAMRRLAYSSRNTERSRTRSSSS